MQANPLPILGLALALGLSGCASSRMAPTSKHQPQQAMSNKTLEQVDPATVEPRVVPTEFADQVVMPGVYRAYLVNGRIVMQRETDPRILAAPPSAMRYVVGNPEKGEISYNPLMLEQELAQALASVRNSSGRNDAALRVVVQKAGDLQQASAEMRRSTGALAQQVTTQAAYIAELEKKLAAIKAAEAEAAKPKK